MTKKYYDQFDSSEMLRAGNKLLQKSLDDCRVEYSSTTKRLREERDASLRECERLQLLVDMLKADDAVDDASPDVGMKIGEELKPSYGSRTGGKSSFNIIEDLPRSDRPDYRDR